MMKEAIEARERGVLFDIGHGGASFDFGVGQKALSLGFYPDLISTDLHTGGINGPVFSQALTMSKMMALGLSEEDVIGKFTRKPAEILGIEDFQTTLIGKKAEFTLYSIEDKEVVVSDSRGNEFKVEKQFSPKYTIVGSRITECEDVLI
ncbi:MAG: hypothetical protein JXA95_12355 [Spirochaetales bacterium]|nr:hypothetical protein [Spirochaetales bacterium]